MSLPDHIIFAPDPGGWITDNKALTSYSSVAVLVDENTHKACYPLIQNSLPEHHLIFIRSGEENKNLETCQKIWGAMTEAQLDRSALLINLGGGVICDMGGFCAATYKRGINFINFPTSLLAQVDASVGGKLGVDFGALKNHIGMFKEPEKVVISSVFLKTLPEIELLSGYAEMLKHALIADAGEWDKLSTRELVKIPALEEIKHSVEIKHKIVVQDPAEKGVRKLLNFGHTIGHAIEGTLLRDSNRKITHGAAVAWGMVAESKLAMGLSGLKEGDFKSISACVERLYAKPDLREADWPVFESLILQDKKNKDKAVLATLIREAGIGVYDIRVEPRKAWEACLWSLNQT